MNTSSIAQTTHSIRYYRQREKIVFDSIPGINELRTASSVDHFLQLQAQYPDASFALMTASNLFCKDRELNAIYLKAYQAILNGEPISDVRFHFDHDLEDYLERHLWDD